MEISVHGEKKMVTHVAEVCQNASLQTRFCRTALLQIVRNFVVEVDIRVEVHT